MAVGGAGGEEVWAGVVAGYRVQGGRGDVYLGGL